MAVLSLMSRDVLSWRTLNLPERTYCALEYAVSNSSLVGVGVKDTLRFVRAILSANAI